MRLGVVRTRRFLMMALVLIERRCQQSSCERTDRAIIPTRSIGEPSSKGSGGAVGKYDRMVV
jgi:hypothetical protein